MIKEKNPRSRVLSLSLLGEQQRLWLDLERVVTRVASGGIEKDEKDKISLLEKELIKLSVKSSSIFFQGKLTLLCSVWTWKSYNPDSFHAQMRNIWKTREKFEIRVAVQNLFTILFDEKGDLERIIYGRPWLFHK